MPRLRAAAEAAARERRFVLPAGSSACHPDATARTAVTRGDRFGLHYLERGFLQDVPVGVPALSLSALQPTSGRGFIAKLQGSDRNKSPGMRIVTLTQPRLCVPLLP